MSSRLRAVGRWGSMCECGSIRGIWLISASRSWVSWSDGMASPPLGGSYRHVLQISRRNYNRREPRIRCVPPQNQASDTPRKIANSCPCRIFRHSRVAQDRGRGCNWHRDCVEVERLGHNPRGPKGRFASPSDSRVVPLHPDAEEWTSPVRSLPCDLLPPSSADWTYQTPVTRQPSFPREGCHFSVSPPVI